MHAMTRYIFTRIIVKIIKFRYLNKSYTLWCHYQRKHYYCFIVDPHSMSQLQINFWSSHNDWNESGGAYSMSWAKGWMSIYGRYYDPICMLYVINMFRYVGVKWGYSWYNCENYYHLKFLLHCPNTEGVVYFWRDVSLGWFVGSLTSLCHSNGHIETMPAREINPFTALTRIRSQFLRTQWSTRNHQRVDKTTRQTAQPSGMAGCISGASF